MYTNKARFIKERKDMSSVLQQLKDIDQVAYVRFASVYRKFDNIDSFMEELKALKKLAGVVAGVCDPSYSGG